MSLAPSTAGREAGHDGARHRAAKGDAAVFLCVYRTVSRLLPSGVCAGLPLRSRASTVKR